jgi:predicted amidohydrolase YtcJ
MLWSLMRDVGRDHGTSRRGMIARAPRRPVPARAAAVPATQGATALRPAAWLGALLATLIVGCAAPAPPADLVLLSGRVYTVEADRPWAQAVAVRGDRIVRVGGDDEIRRLAGPATKVIDLKGRLLLPGLIDGHTHFLDGSIGLTQVDLTGVTTLPAIQERVRAYAAAHPDEPWILGFGWLYSTFAPSGLPVRKDLDAVESRRPVFLYSYDGHSAWANSAALRAAEVDARTPQLRPSQGEIIKDPKTGAPTGALKEGAMGLVEKVVPKPSREQRLAALEKGLARAASLGVTSVENCSGGPEEVELYDELERQGKLTLRTVTAWPMPDHPQALTDGTVAKIVALRDSHQGRFVRAGTVKFFADGVIESFTAALLAPYTTRPEVKGTPHYDARQLAAMVRKVDEAGLQIYIHAIGDAAVRMSLDALEEAMRAHPGRQRRNRLEHIETIDAADIPRFGRLGIIASMQPFHAYYEPNLANVWAKNIGPERVTRAFAWHSIAAAGGRLVFGTDWPVVGLEPMPGIRNAVLRQSTEGEPPGGWVPGERVTLGQAIAAYTINGAFASFEEDLKGSIKEGKLADLVVLSQDLFTIPAENIHETKALLTLVSGREVYRDPGF